MEDKELELHDCKEYNPNNNSWIIENTIALAQYANLYSDLQITKRVAQDKLTLLELEYKRLWTADNTDKMKATNMQLRLNAQKNLIEELDRFEKNIARTYLELARTYNSKDREMFVLMYFYRMSNADIVNKLNYSPITVTHKRTMFNKVIKRELEKVKYDRSVFEVSEGV